MGSKWPTSTIGAIAEVKSGKRLPKGTRLTAEKTTHPYVRVVDFSGGRISEANLQYVPEEVFPRIKRYTVDVHDIVISIVGTIGLVATIPPALHKASLTENAAKILLNTSAVCGEYVAWYLRSPAGQHEIMRHTVGSTQAKLPLYGIKSLEIRYPSLPEQRAIAHILGTLDDKIELNRRMNGTLESMAAAVFKSWFVDFDPVIDNALAAGNPIPDALADKAARRADLGDARQPLPDDLASLFPNAFQDSPLGPIPEGWEAGMLGDIADNTRRSVKPEEIAPDTPYIGLQLMPRQSIALDAWGRADEVGSGKSRFDQGDILFGKLRPYFHKVGIAPVDGVCSTDILVIVPKAEHWRGYVLSLTSSKPFVDYADAHSAGTKMPRTNWKDLSRYPLAIPPEGLFEAFESTVAASHATIQTNIQENRTLTATRDTLLPKLLSGELDVSSIETSMEAE